MKKVATNITFGQILFILIIFTCASLIFFYLGAKFGPEILRLTQSGTSMDQPILPDEKMANEVKELLKLKTHQFVFHETLQNKQSVENLKPGQEPLTSLNIKSDLTKETTQKTRDEDKVAENTVSQIKPAETKQDKTLKTTETTVAAAKLKTKEEQTVKNNPVLKEKPVTETVAKKVEIKKVDNIKVKTAELTVIDNTIEATEPEVSLPSYGLQIGSYSNVDKANQAQKMWSSRGFNARVVSYNIKDKGTWYRLQIGGYNSLNDAKSAQMAVMNKYRQSARVVTVK